MGVWSSKTVSIISSKSLFFIFLSLEEVGSSSNMAVSFDVRPSIKDGDIVCVVSRRIESVFAC